VTSSSDARVEQVDDLASLRQVLEDAARGIPPPADHRTMHIPVQPSLAIAGVFGFTAHHFVAADVDHQWLRRCIGAGAYASMSADFVAALAVETGGVAGAFDTVLVLPGAGVDPAAVGLVRTGLAAHSRVRRASTYRTSLRTYSTPDGACVAVLGRGVAGRLEAAFEIEPAARGSGRGRRLVSAVAAVAPRGMPVFFQCAPGNVASLRSILGAGARPIGSEVLISAQSDL
jgi:GNAT superfamily N-acetyltransferase